MYHSWVNAKRLFSKRKRLYVKKSHQVTSNSSQATAHPALATFYHYRTPQLSHEAFRCPKVFRKQQDNVITIGTVPAIQMLTTMCTKGLADTSIRFIRRPGQSAWSGGLTGIHQAPSGRDGRGNRMIAHKRWLFSKVDDGHWYLERVRLSSSPFLHIVLPALHHNTQDESHMCFHQD